MTLRLGTFCKNACCCRSQEHLGQWPVALLSLLPLLICTRVLSLSIQTLVHVSEMTDHCRAPRYQPAGTAVPLRQRIGFVGLQASVAFPCTPSRRWREWLDCPPLEVWLHSFLSLAHIGGGWCLTVRAEDRYGKCCPRRDRSCCSCGHSTSCQA